MARLRRDRATDNGVITVRLNVWEPDATGEGGWCPRSSDHIVSELCRHPLFERHPLATRQAVTLLESKGTAPPTAQHFCSAECFWTHVFTTYW